MALELLCLPVRRVAMSKHFHVIAAVLFFVMIASTVHAESDLDPWYFSASEIETAYRYQEMFGERLSNPLKARDCLLGKNEFVATYKGKEFLAPCSFVKETLRHIKEILEKGAAKYLFPLDLDHAHLALPANLWENKYSHLPRENILPALLREPALAALYHSAEHLTVVDAGSRKVNPEAKEWKEKRNVLGFYDGRPIKILTPNANGSGVGVPESYESFGGFNFAANPKGQLHVFVGNKAIVFDLTFDIGDVDEDQLPGHIAAKTPAN